MVLEDVYLWFSHRLISKRCVYFLVFFLIELVIIFFLLHSLALGSRHNFHSAAYVPITPAFLSATVCSLLGELQGRRCMPTLSSGLLGPWTKNTTDSL